MSKSKVDKILLSYGRQRDMCDAFQDLAEEIGSLGDRVKTEGWRPFVDDFQALKDQQPSNRRFFRLAYKKWLMEVIECHQALFQGYKFGVSGLNDTHESVIQLNQHEAMKLVLRIHSAFMKIPHIESLVEIRAREEFVYSAMVLRVNTMRREESMMRYINQHLELLGESVFKAKKCY